MHNDGNAQHFYIVRASSGTGGRAIARSMLARTVAVCCSCTGGAVLTDMTARKDRQTPSERRSTRRRGNSVIRGGLGGTLFMSPFPFIAGAAEPGCYFLQP